MNGRRYRGAARRIGYPRFRKAVISIHGIWSTGKWQAEVSPALQDADIRHQLVHYAIRRVPLGTKPVIERIVQAYDKHRSSNPDMRISVIAHSFGTLAFGEMLYGYPSVQFERAILYGCVMPRKFDWPDIARRQQIGKVLHEVCPKDRIVSAARFLPFCGPSGCDGFLHKPNGLIRECHYNHTGHSKLGTEMHARNVWVPFILDGQLPC